MAALFVRALRRARDCWKLPEGFCWGALLGGFRGCTSSTAGVFSLGPGVWLKEAHSGMYGCVHVEGPWYDYGIVLIEAQG